MTLILNTLRIDLVDVLVTGRPGRFTSMPKLTGSFRFSKVRAAFIVFAFKPIQINNSFEAGLSTIAEIGTCLNPLFHHWSL
jgi:hypothetical protein